MFMAILLGTVFGFLSAVPIAGPIAAFIFSQGMKGRYAQARWVALGASLVEGAYTFLAFWGFNQLLTRFSFIFVVSNAVAAVILAGLGIYFLRSKKMREPVPLASQTEEVSRSSRAFFIGVGVSAINPSLIATWAATITTLYSMNLFEFSNRNAAFFSVGVIVGIFAWFNLSLRIIAKHRGRFKVSMLDLMLKIVGGSLLAVSAWMFFRLVKQLS